MQRTEAEVRLLFPGLVQPKVPERRFVRRHVQTALHRLPRLCKGESSVYSLVNNLRSSDQFCMDLISKVLFAYSEHSQVIDTDCLIISNSDSLLISFVVAESHQGTELESWRDWQASSWHRQRETEPQRWKTQRADNELNKSGLPNYLFDSLEWYFKSSEKAVTL